MPKIPRYDDNGAKPSEQHNDDSSEQPSEQPKEEAETNAAKQRSTKHYDNVDDGANKYYHDKQTKPYDGENPTNSRRTIERSDGNLFGDRPT